MRSKGREKSEAGGTRKGDNLGGKAEDRARYLETREKKRGLGKGERGGEITDGGNSPTWARGLLLLVMLEGGWAWGVPGPLRKFNANYSKEGRRGNMGGREGDRETASWKRAEARPSAVK